MTVILINTTKENVWIQQPLLVTELFTMDQIHQIDHRANMDRKGDNIKKSFLLVAFNIIRVQLQHVQATSFDMTSFTSSDKPAFGPRPNSKPMHLNFEAEDNFLPFKLNLTHVQQSWFINTIYDHPEVFSLYDKDLRFHNRIKHTIPAILNKPVYLLHHIIPPQLQGEVHKCLDTWL